MEDIPEPQLDLQMLWKSEVPKLESMNTDSATATTIGGTILHPT